MQEKHLVAPDVLVGFDEFGMVEIHDRSLLETVSAGLFNTSVHADTKVNGFQCGNDDNIQTNGACTGNVNGFCLAGVNGSCGTNNNCYQGRGGSTPNTEVWIGPVGH